jgi:hypothetical protein
MPSAQDCAKRLREQAYRTLSPQIRDLDQALQNVSNSLSAGLRQIGEKLEALSHIELPTTELVLDEILGDVIREAESKANALFLFARHLRQKETQEEILALFLDAAHEYSPRTALFAVRENRFIGWSSRGFPEAIAREISAGSFLRSDCPKFDEVLAGGNPVTASDLLEDAPLQFLQDEIQGTCRLVPLCVLDRPVALLLASGTEFTESGSDTLAILAEFTVLQLENIALRILYELSSERREISSQQVETSQAEAPAVEPEPSPAEEQAEAAPPPTESAPEPVPVFDQDSPAAPAPAEEQPVVFIESPVAASFDQEEPVQEPETVKAPETRPFPEEEKLHSDAKRFARLLVSEIKLYNEHHVTEGRENRDLYLRLKRDIDRSREMYEKRVSPNVARKIDYFHDEVIRILGDNDPSTLGSDYPGPRVES